MFSDHTKVADGTYQIQNNATYPDAYIVVEDGEAQFFNIDLNELYKDDIVEKYIMYLKNYKNQSVTSADEEQIKNSIDLNERFCKTKFALDYSEENYNFVDDRGIGNYNFGTITDISYLSYEYDWKNQSITLNREDAELIKFKR